MRSYAAVFLVCLTTSACADPASVFGTVSGADGVTLEHAPLQVVNSSTGERTRTYTAKGGHYEIAGLEPGDYTISVNWQCCAYEDLEDEPITLESGQALQFDVVLAEEDNLIALSDDPGWINAEVRNRRVLPDAPVPRQGDRPDLSGVWLMEDDPFPEDPKPLPWAEKFAEEFDWDDFSTDPWVNCLPGDLPIAGVALPYMAKIVQTPDLIVILFEGPPGYRQIFLDGREAPEYPNPSWLGYSVGHWEGDTLVVESTGFNDRGMTDDYPRTDEMRIVERYTRTEYGYLELVMTTHDPGVFEEPWERHLHFDLVPQEELIESVCENNVWVSGSE